VLRHLYSSRLAGDLSTTSSSSALAALSESSNSAAAAAAITASAADNLLLLHQVGRAALLYAKNGVVSQAGGQSLGDLGPGYLSLHSTQTGLVVKWLPNSVMLGGGSGGTPPPSPSSVAEGASPLSADAGIDDSISSPSDVESSLLSNRSAVATRRQDSADGQSGNWEAAFLIRVEEMVYIHCHGDGGGGSLVFVARDGTQQPPLHFPPGGSSGSSCDNLLQFLTSLETGLAPNAWLDPPLWTQCGRRGRPDGQSESSRKSLFGDSFLAGLLASATSRGLAAAVGSSASRSASAAHSGDENGDDAADYVFRIVLRGGGFSFESAADSNLGLQLAWQREEGARRDSRASATESPAPQPEQRQASIQQLCSSMRRQILSRAFNGWLSQMRHARTVRRYLAGLLDGRLGVGRSDDFPAGLTAEIWERAVPEEIYRAIYWGGCRPEMRKKVWPLMLGFHPWDSTETERRSLDQAAQARFENLLSEWGPVDVIVRENDKEQVINARDILRKKLEAVEAAAAASAKSKVKKQQQNLRPQNRRLPDPPPPPPPPSSYEESPVAVSAVTDDPENQLGADAAGNCSLLSTSRESLASPASPASNGGVYSAELIKTVTENWHRIDKDVTRCDRHITFFSDDEHLEKLRNIMCCYVWENLQVGYIQGFCDLLAPLLIVLEDEGLTLACFEKLMLRMVANFPTDEVELRETTMSAAAPEAAAVEAEAAGRAEANGPDSSRKRQHRSLMNQQLANLSAALQVMDPQLHEHIVRKGEQERTGIGPQQQQQQQQLQQLHMHFCFCFRWLLLDFKREICYNDVFLVWETIWAAVHLESSHFSIFVAVALLQEYRSFIMENDMNLADVTMFYIDMAERHNASNLLQRARDLLDQLIQMYFDRVSTGEVLAQRGFISPADKEAGG
uniref:Rab-GAP TBC domain-containing protein n=1 Tax=Macrostomum lignano TaxID=282301 RepID=A0A1I8I8L9_9PLAT